MGSIALNSPFQPLYLSSAPNNLPVYGLGTALTQYKYTGGFIDFPTDVNGNATAGGGTAWSAPPSDAVAVEVWMNSNGATDYLFTSTQSGILTAAGVIATNITNNLAASRWVTAGQHLLIPLSTVGSIPAGFRFATGISGGRVQGRYVAQSTGFPYLLGSATQFTVTGAGASAQLPFNSGATFPAGYSAVVFQVVGSGLARFTIDGTTPTAILGDILPPGAYLIDLALHGIALSALRIFLPAGLNVVGNSLVYA